MALQDDEPVTDRRDLKVEKRRELQRKRNGTITPTKKMAVRPTARRALVLVVARGGVHPKKEEIDQKVLTELEDLGFIHKTTSRKGREMWHATDDGRGWVSASGLLPVFLHRRSELGTTHSAAQGLVSAGEDMRPQSDRPRAA